MRGLALALVLVLGAGGCATGLDRAKQTVTFAEKVWSIGYDELVNIDAVVVGEMQAKYDRGEITEDQARAMLESWKVKRTKVVIALKQLKHAFTIAGLGVQAFEAGKAKDATAAMGDVAKALSEALAALAEVGIKLPGWNS